MKGYRVEITGQFNVDNPACSDKSPCQVERQLPPNFNIITIQWNQVCNSINEVLAPLTTIKRVAKMTSLLFYIFLAVFVLGVQLLPRMMPNFDYSLLKYSSVMFVPISVAYLVIYCLYIRRGLSATMDKVREVCEQYSCDGIVHYTLEAEHWGGCNKVSYKLKCSTQFCIWNQLSNL